MMEFFHLEHALFYGLVLSVLASGWVVIVLRINPRVFLRHYPKAIREAAPPLSRSERGLTAILGLPLFALLIGVPLWSGFNLTNGHAAGQAALFLDAFIIGMVFNVVDLVILDVLWLGMFPPRWAMIPGTEHVPYVPEYAKHVGGFIVGTVVAALIATLVSFIVR